MQCEIPPSLRIAFLLLLASILPPAGQQPPAPDASKSPTPALAPAARLAAAKTALLRKTGSGSNVAYDVVSSTLDGWGRFQMVTTADKADVIVEIFSLEESGGGVSVAADGGRGHSTGGGQGTITLIRLTVFDAKTHVPLWTGSERPKGAMKKVDRENNEVESAEQLIRKLHDFLEPPQK